MDTIASTRFREKYRLYATDARKLLQLIPTPVWDQLAALPAHVMLQAHDDVLVFQELPYDSKARTRKFPEELRAMLSLAEQLHGCFREIRQLAARL